MHRRDELNNFVSKAASERIINIMGASDTLADYLVSIRTKKKTKESRFIRKPRITSNMQKRSLVLEIWNATNNNNSINNKRRNIAIDTTQTKRLKTIQPLESLIQPSDSVSKAGYQSSGCTLQPYFTKEEEHHRTQEHHHHHQYQFEFSSDLLDEISLHEMQSTIQSSESSIISQITQDSVLESCEEEEDDDDDTEDNDSYSYSSEEDNYSNDEDESSSQSSPYHHHFEPSTEVKTSEVKEGAQLLLDLLCM